MKPRLVLLFVLVLATIGVVSPALAGSGKRCSLAIHNGVRGTTISENVPEQVPDVHVPVGLGLVKAGVDCDQHK